MANVVVWNPHSAQNPRKRKVLTGRQAEKQQAKAVRFLRDVVDDPDLADEIEGLSIREYAERKGFSINPSKKRKENVTMKREERDKELVRDTVSEFIRQTRRPNPNGQAAAPSVVGTEMKAKSDKGRILDAIDDAVTAWDDGFEDEARDMLIDVLEQSDDES